MLLLKEFTSKYIVSMLLLFSMSPLKGQQFLDGGLKNWFGPSVLVNENVLADDQYITHVSVAEAPGIKLGFNFNESVELAGEAFFGFYHQKFTVKTTGGQWTKDIAYNQVQVPLLLRFNKASGSYFEIGPQYTLNTKITESNSSGVTADAMDYYDKNYFSAILSFGSYLMGWDNLGISAGIRVQYSFNDFISKNGGNAMPDIYSYRAANYQPYKNTVPLSVGLCIEVNYDLGYMAKSPCTGRREFLFF